MLHLVEIHPIRLAKLDGEILRAGSRVSLIDKPGCATSANLNNICHPFPSITPSAPTLFTSSLTYSPKTITKRILEYMSNISQRRVPLDRRVNRSHIAGDPAKLIRTPHIHPATPATPIAPAVPTHRNPLSSLPRGPSLPLPHLHHALNSPHPSDRYKPNVPSR